MKITQRHERMCYANETNQHRLGGANGRPYLPTIPSTIRHLLAPESLRAVEAVILGEIERLVGRVYVSSPGDEGSGLPAARSGAVPLRHGTAMAPDRIGAVGTSSRRGATRTGVLIRAREPAAPVR